MTKFHTIGYLHDPRINLDRVHVQTDGSLDEEPRLRLSGPDLAAGVYVSARTVESILSDADNAYDVGKESIAYGQLSAALRALVAPQFAQACFCPDDCGCRSEWRRNVCGCRAH